MDRHSGDEELFGAVDIIKQGRTPLYIKPYLEKKVWGIGGIGEYWYGAEKGEKTSMAEVGEITVPMDKLIEKCADLIIGEKVVKKFGAMLPLTKILTPKGRLSVQFHDSKNELWVVTGIDPEVAGREPSIILGFSPKAVSMYGKDVTAAYRKALEFYGDKLNDLIVYMEKKGYRDAMAKAGDSVRSAEASLGRDLQISGPLNDLEEAGNELALFYNRRRVSIGDVIPVPSGTLHALTGGIQVLEPQIPGPTQSMEDGATYPVRYAFPKHMRPGAAKVLDIDRVGEIIPSVVKETPPLVLENTGSVKVERLPGGFEDKGMEVRRLTLKKGAELEFRDNISAHLLAIVNEEGGACIMVSGSEEKYNIVKAEHGSKLLIVPAAIKAFKVLARQDSHIIDTFSPVG